MPLMKQGRPSHFGKRRGLTPPVPVIVDVSASEGAPEPVAKPRKKKAAKK